MSSEPMGATKKAKVTFTCEPDLKDGLEDWARSESRTLSNLIEMVVRHAYEIHQKQPYPSDRPQPQPPTASKTNGKGRGKSKQPQPTKPESYE